MSQTEMTEEIRKRIDQYGAEVDRLSIGGEYDKLKLLIDEMEQAKNADEEIKRDAAFNYYLGTACGAYSDQLVRSGKNHTDSDVIVLRRTSMYYLRKGLASYDPSIHTDPRAQLRILTNYANGLDTAGRVIEALRIYRKVLTINEHFSIARGNYGRALQFLANMVNDDGHYKVLHCYAYQAVKKALSIDDPDMHEQAIAAFQHIVNQYEASPSRNILAEPIVNKEYELGKTAEEKEYRTWCLRNHLFLNPLNEVVERDSAFAHDPLTIITYTEDIHASDSVSGNPVEPPRWFAMLNQLKEEYVYARYLCYEGTEKYGEVHFADKDVNLSLASYDYVNYSIRIEQLKSSFRISYSLLDQICFFVNEFWKFGLNERDADAYHICKKLSTPQDNIVLMALYWVLCEFFEKYGEAETASEKDLAVLRNALEHKYVKVHEYEWKKALKIERDSFYHVSENDLREHTMRLLELTREALMYLVYAIGVEESKKENTDKSVPMPLTVFLDEWKL